MDITSKVVDTKGNFRLSPFEGVTVALKVGESGGFEVYMTDRYRHGPIELHQVSGTDVDLQEDEYQVREVYFTWAKSPVVRHEEAIFVVIELQDATNARCIFEGIAWCDDVDSMGKVGSEYGRISWFEGTDEKGLRALQDYEDFYAEIDAEIYSDEDP